MVLPTLPWLSFAPGESVSTIVERSLDLPISSPVSSSRSFALVVSFSRCKFRLDTSSVSIILQASIGGCAAYFRVSHLAGRAFKFYVSSKPVGFSIVKLCSFSCPEYSLFFHLWGNGGPNWRRELSLSCLKKNVPGFLLATVVRPPARRLWFALIFLLRMLFVHVWTQPRTSVL